jgi:hypothetical protein
MAGLVFILIAYVRFRPRPRRVAPGQLRGFLLTSFSRTISRAIPIVREIDIEPDSGLMSAEKAYRTMR